MGCSTRGEMIMADISVPYWNIVDVNMLCEGARLIGFDLDNTLARSKKPMKADMAECFSALTSLIDVAVITGGKYSLLQSQVVDRLSDHADKSKLHLMPTSGTRYYRWDGQRWGKVFSHDLSDEDRAKAKESLERNAREQGIWATHVWGERIEDRGSQITFSALGQLAPVEAKEAWDPTKNYQRTGLESEYYEILGVNIPSTIIPVSPGRNLAVVLETAAINNRQKKMGYNAAKELLIRLGLNDTMD